MATSKQSFVRATEPQCSVSAQREEETHVQAPLTTMFVHNVPTPGLQPYPQAQPGGLQDATVVPLFLPRMCSNSTLPSLTLHIGSRAALQQQRLVAPAISARTKSVGKHICPHCGKDCLKPSVLEKHLRCHTGERPYPCTTCGISFKTQSNLYKHKRTQAHARLSIESDKGTFSSQESMESSKDNFTSSSSEIDGGNSIDIKRSQEVLPVVSTTKQTTQTNTVSGIEWALHHAAVVGFSTTPVLQEKVNSLRKTVEFSADVKSNPAIQQASALSEDGYTPVISNRTPLQRQEALFSKPWDSPMSRGKSQSHDSTDSGFSDSSEHHSSSSPGASLHDPSMESLTETTMEQHEPGASQMPSEITSEDNKSKVSIQEKQKLEEHISKLIYENSVLVDNKQLENVRPRKTILSKQGSIDLPVPYTYKDSFHFEIRNSKHIPSSQNQDKGGGAIHSIVPTQPYTSLEHAPLTRSSSLPFTMGGKPTDGAMNLNLSRRCSAGHVYPIRSSNQQTTGHRSLVRQVAVDCLPGAEGSPVERGSMSSLSSDGDSTDFGTEPCIKGNYRKKARKFDYTKWHTYKGGTFRKLYNTDKDCPLKTKKTALSSEPTECLESQTCQQRDNGPVSLSFTSGSVVALQNDLKASYTNCENNNVKGSDMESDELVTQHTDCYIPSERKKQRTGNGVQTLSISDPKVNVHGLMNQSILPTSSTLSSITDEARKVNKQNHPQGSFIQPFSNLCQFRGKTPSAAFCLVSMSGTSGTPSGSFSSPTVPEAKTSFPPMYQLKIPCPTDGVSASCSGSALEHSTCSVIPALRQSHQTTEECHLEKSVLSSKQCRGTSAVTTFPQSKQDVLCVTTSMPMLSISCSGLKQTNTLSKVLTPLQSATPSSVSFFSPMLLPPVQHQVALLQSDCTTRVVENQSSGPVSSVLYHPFKVLTTSENSQPVASTNTASTMSFCSESGQQIYSPVTVTSTVENHSPFPVTESGKPLGLTMDPKSIMHENTLDCTASKMPTGDFQRSQSEEKNILLNDSAQAQKMFYVRTAELQIVMQLISDEQLALIEPHIETTTTAITSTTQASLSQEVYRNNVTVCVAQKTENNGDMKKETTCCLNSHNVKNYANAIPQCVSSWSHPQTKFHISASVDYNKNSKQQLYEPQKIPENLPEKNSAGFKVTTQSGHKLVTVDKLSEPHLVDKSHSRRENDKEIQNCCVHKRDTVSCSEDQTSADITRDKGQCCLKESNHAQSIKNSDPLELNETDHLMSVTLSEKDERVHTKTTTWLGTCICEKKMSATESHQMQKVLNSTIHHYQNRPYLDTKEMGASDLGKLSCKHGTLVIETFCPSQTPTQHEFQQAFALGPGGDDSYGQVKASCPVPNRTSNVRCVLEDSTKCGDVVHTYHANLEIFTGHPGEDGTRKNKESIHKEHENGGEEGKRPSTEVADTNNTCQGCKETDKQDKRKEEATSCEEHQTFAQAHLHFSKKVSFNISESLLHEEIYPETSTCTNILSQTGQLQDQVECNTRKDGMNEHLGNGHSQETGQKETSSMCMGKYSNQTCRHSPSLNTMQSEFQKETQTRGAMSYWIYSKGAQSQMLSSQHKMSATTVSASAVQNNCSVSKPETVNAIVTSSSGAGPSSCNALHQMTIQEPHTHQLCPPAIHSNSKEPKQFYLGNNSYLEHEDSNSSSDDEQKLVIELE